MFRKLYLIARRLWLKLRGRAVPERSWFDGNVIVDEYLDANGFYFWVES